MSMKCIECANATETTCAKCLGVVPVCPDMPAYQNTCTTDHFKKAHVTAPVVLGSRFAEANIIVKGVRAEAEQARHERAVAEGRAVNAEARHAALVKFLSVAYPEAHMHAKKDGLI